MKTFRSILAASGSWAVILALGTGTASTHHSTAAFDTTTVVKIDGTITQFRWINPHASIKIDGVTEGDAPDGLWTVEMTAPNVLINQGWKRNSLNVGDKVTIFVNPLRNTITLKDGSQGALYVGVVLADGSTLGRTDGRGEGTSD
jgi:Family of unknown function (DUF6152)